VAAGQVRQPRAWRSGRRLAQGLRRVWDRRQAAKPLAENNSIEEFERLLLQKGPGPVSEDFITAALSVTLYAPFYAKDGQQYPFPYQIEGETYGILLTRADMPVPPQGQLMQVPFQQFANYMLGLEKPQVVVQAPTGYALFDRSDLERIAKGGDPMYHRQMTVPVGSNVALYPFNPQLSSEIVSRLRTVAVFGHTEKAVATMMSINGGTPQACVLYRPTPNGQFEWLCRKVWEFQTDYIRSLITMSLDAFPPQFADSCVPIYERPAETGSALQLPDDVQITVGPVKSALPEAAVAEFRDLGMECGLDHLGCVSIDLAGVIDLYCFVYQPFPCDPYAAGIEAIKARHGLSQLNTPMMPWDKGITEIETVIFERNV